MSRASSRHELKHLTPPLLLQPLHHRHHHKHNNRNNNFSCIRSLNNNDKNRFNSSIPPRSHIDSLSHLRGQKWWRWVWRSWCLVHWWRKHNPIRLCSCWGSLGILWRPSVTSALRHMLRSDDTQNCTMTSSIGWYQLFNRRLDGFWNTLWNNNGHQLWVKLYALTVFFFTCCIKYFSRADN